MASMQYLGAQHGRPQVQHGRLGRLVPLATAVFAASHQQQASCLHELSIVLLVSQNLKRTLGRGLVPDNQLLQAQQIVHKADYAIVVIGNDSMHNQTCSSAQQQQSEAAAPWWPVVYTNTAGCNAVIPVGAHQGPNSSSQQPSQTVITPQQQHQQRWVQLPAPFLQVHLEEQKYVQQRQQQQQQQWLKSHAEAALNCCSWLPDAPLQCLCAAAEASITAQQMLAVSVLSPDDSYFGLALLFDSWRHPDGCLGAPGWPYVSPDQLPKQQQMDDAAAAVRDQAAAVRQLKQVQGLGNKEPAVVEAVAVLQTLKQQLADLESLQEAFQGDRQGTLQQLMQLLAAKQGYTVPI